MYATQVNVREITEYSSGVLIALEKLLPQLSKSAALPSENMVRNIVDSECSRLLVAEEGDLVLGMLTIVIFSVPSGVRAWIEDVVVNESRRGKGIGEALGLHALKLARSEGAKTVGLTSRPTREAANRLYKRIGFVSRDTNVYRYELDT